MEDFIRIGRDILLAQANDLFVLHGIRIDQDLSDSHCLEVGKAKVESDIQAEIARKNEEKEEAKRVAAMDEYDRLQYEASRAYHQKWGIFS